MHRLCVYILVTNNDIIETTLVLKETSLKRITTHLQYTSNHESLTQSILGILDHTTTFHHSRQYHIQHLNRYLLTCIRSHIIKGSYMQGSFHTSTNQNQACRPYLTLTLSNTLYFTFSIHLINDTNIEDYIYNINL